MDIGTLIERSMDGDWQAFADLVKQHQSLAFGYAFAMLGDFHLAEDATQEAFVAVYFQLHTLRSSDAFIWWLRGVVRHQCSRILRKRRLQVVSLEQAAEVGTGAQSLDEQVVERASAAEVVAAINTMPHPQREVLALFYVKDYSRRQIAEFLDVPLTTVNNRLHAARSQLKRRMVAMTKEAFAANALPDDFATTVGKLLEIRGPVVDMEFPPDQRPALLSVLRITDDARSATFDATVAQHLSNGRVRSIVASSPDELTPGMRVTRTGGWVEQPLDEATLKEALQHMGGSESAVPLEITQTGIKGIDLLAPYPKGGKVGILGPMGVGKMVLMEEIIHNLRARDEALSLFSFIKPGAEVELFQGVADEAAELSLSLAQIIILTSPDPREAGSLAESFDALTFMSIQRAVNQFWPAIDLLRSNSRLLTPEVVGREHYDVATGVRELLRRHKSLDEHIRTEAVYQLSPDDKQVLRRGRRIERFFTQYFSVAEAWTKRPGSYVSIADTVRGCASILAGECDDLPEEAFTYCGTIDEVWAKADRSK